ncbi:hypothetical protein BH11GEM1_BH11GEM1_07930 [soil metagenome]
MAFDTERRYNRSDRAPVRWIVHPTHKSVRLETIRQLGYVGAHALEASCQLAKRQRLACLDEGVERLILGAGKPNGLQRRFQAVLN